MSTRSESRMTPEEIANMIAEAVEVGTANAMGIQSLVTYVSLKEIAPAIFVEFYDHETGEKIETAKVTVSLVGGFPA